MGTSNLILSSLFLASSLATHYNLQALHDVSASAEIVGRASEIIPIPDSSSRSAEYYNMEIYLEEENAVIPVKIISQPCLVSEAQTITLSLAVEKDVTFEINEEISESLSTSVGVEVGLDIIGSLKTEIASSLFHVRINFSNVNDDYYGIQQFPLCRWRRKSFRCLC